ncbi:MAG: flagellin [Hydrogenophilales bacterium CG12_big_fil_rev_8_21_14_0_65_61_21]|nr:MAG: flagellin [Hydrogenophilales bacterium CG12_big_fil_rev_8_21_14_0_65_61_21]
MSNTVNLTSAMRANLLSLQQTAQLQGQTQQRLSTGLKVNSALDNPASYFAAAGYNQRADQLSTLKDNIGEAIQMIKTADTGVTGLRSMIASLSGQLTQAGAALGQSTSGTLLQAAADSYNSVIKQMNDLSQTDSTYKGVNFLQSTTTLTVDFNETSTTSITLSGFDGSTTGLSITGGAVAVGAQGNLTTANIDTTAEIAAVQTSLNDALATLQSESAKLAGNLSTLQTRQSFMSSMMNNLADGANNLTAADTNQEGASMLMLQTRQSLGVTSLSLASQAAQSILRLF